MENQNNKFNHLLPVSFLISILMIVGALIYNTGLKSINTIQNETEKKEAVQNSDFQENIVPSNGVELPIKWRNLGKQLVGAGVIDAKKFETLYAKRSELTKEQKNLLYAEDNGNLVISPKNASFILNLFWAFGLSNKNPVLENGPMVDSRYGGAQNFASTAGWTLAEGGPMTHYNKHQFITLTPEQQALVEKVSKNIYRPCCDNSTYFPDCNHGMAMLGFLELTSSQGFNEDELYQMALILNSYWFPDNYLAIGKYLANQGTPWKEVNAKEILGYDFSSVSGYQKILAQVEQPNIREKGSCSV